MLNPGNGIVTAPLRLLPKQASAQISPQEPYNKKKSDFSKDTGPPQGQRTGEEMGKPPRTKLEGRQGKSGLQIE